MACHANDQSCKHFQRQLHQPLVTGYCDNNLNGSLGRRAKVDRQCIRKDHDTQVPSLCIDKQCLVSHVLRRVHIYFCRICPICHQRYDVSGKWLLGPCIKQSYARSIVR